MIYLKRLWNLIAMLFIVCVFILITISATPIEIVIITPIRYILKNENYPEKYAPFSFRVMWWLESKLLFNTNKK
jgi:hypothetical protein